MTITLPERETITEKPPEVRILERAALIIEEHGHCCGSLFQQGTGQNMNEYDCPINDPRLTYCEVGAIWRAGFEFGVLPRTMREFTYESDEYDAYTVIGRAVGLSERLIDETYDFNDGARNAKASAAHLRQLAQEWQSTKNS